VAFTLAILDGWIFTCSVMPEDDGGGDVPKLADFTLRGECPHGRELLEQSLPPSTGPCGCVPSAAVLARMRQLFDEWTARLGQPFQRR
jgi:hypothetical protein